MYIYQNDILKRSYIRYMWPCSSVWEHIRTGHSDLPSLRPAFDDPCPILLDHLHWALLLATFPPSYGAWSGSKLKRKRRRRWIEHTTQHVRRPVLTHSLTHSLAHLAAS